MDRLFTSYFAKRACNIVGRAARIPIPNPFLKPVIDAYSLAVGVAKDDFEEPGDGFHSFSDFFGRRLKPGSRPICDDADAVVSPSDGDILEFGTIDDGKNPAFTIKGNRYSLDALLGKVGAGHSYGGGGYMVTYLHPRDYHRVHAPCACSLKTMRHIPGARYPVNHWLRDTVNCIYNKNERTVFQFSLSGGREISIVMVAAFGVGNIETRFHFGATGTDVLKERCFNPEMELLPGDELGAFLLGSTVVSVWSKDCVKLDKGLLEGPVAMGRRLGTTRP